MFGMLYGLGVVTLFALLEHLGAPKFYDKLMAVPLMNMCIQVIDRLAQSPSLRRFDPTVRLRTLPSRQRHLVYIGVWALVFIVMSDPGYWLRPRRWLPFWEDACMQSRHHACETFGGLVKQYCRQGSGWACNELGIFEAEGRTRSGVPAQAAFQRACVIGFSPGCENTARISSGARSFMRLPPRDVDYPILLQEGSVRPAGETPQELYARACKQGWKEACNADSAQQR
jgi:hypothetical protein